VAGAVFSTILILPAPVKGSKRNRSEYIQHIKCSAECALSDRLSSDEKTQPTQLMPHEVYFGRFWPEISKLHKKCSNSKFEKVALESIINVSKYAVFDSRLSSSNRTGDAWICVNCASFGHVPVFEVPVLVRGTSYEAKSGFSHSR
jgi:hypothetical protein